MNIFPEIPGQKFESKKRQKWDVQIQTSASKRRKSMTNQVYPEWEIEVDYTGLTKENADKMMGFYGQQKGPLTPFLFKDMEDYKVIGQNIGVGTGLKQNIYLLRTVGNGVVVPVYDVVPNTLKIYSAGEEIEYNLGNDGLVTVTTIKDNIITADFEYYWRVAFDNDYCEQTLLYYDIYQNSTIKLVSVL